MLRRALKVFFYLLFGLALFAGVWFLGQYLGWPRETVLFLAAISFSVLLCVLAVRRYLHRRREKAYLYRHISEEMPSMPVKQKTKGPSGNIRKLRNSWDEGIDVLQKSIPMKDGDPIYAQPWYLIFGESGSGKSSAIASARLSGPVPDSKQAEEIVSTINCEWHFSNNAIYLDTAGRYAITEDEDIDREEWDAFLALLLKYRPKEPVNGIVLVLSVDRLQKDSEDQLERTGRLIRSRLDEAVKTLGVEFPVWLLVTKMDHVTGFRDFAAELPKDVRDQAMGQGFAEDSYKVPGAFGNGFDTIVKRLKELSAKVLATEDSDVNRFLALSAFQKDFAALKTRLICFLNALCEDNNYLAPVPIRGMYFSSARQKECVSLLDTFPDLKNAEAEKEDGQLGLFLHDLFDKFIPADCGLWKPEAKDYAPERRILQYTMLAWLILCGCAFTYFTYDFSRNRSVLANFHRQVSSNTFLTKSGVGQDTLQALDKYRQGIQDLRGNTFIPGVYSQSAELRTVLQKDFCARMEVLYRSHNSPSLFSSKKMVSGNDYQEIIFLIRRISLLESRLNGMSYAKLMELPYSENDFPKLPEVRTPQAVQQLKAVNMAWLSWMDEAIVETEVQKARKELVSQLSIQTPQDNSLDWIFEWIADLQNAPPIRPETFISRLEPTGSSDLVIEGAFTLAGREEVKSLLEIFRRALNDSDTYSRMSSTFLTRYENLYTNAWLNFARRFPEYLLQNDMLTSNASVASSMASQKNACFAFLGRATTELAFTEDWPQKPEWLELLHFLQMSKDVGGKSQGERRRALLDKLTGNFRKTKTTLSVASRLDGVTMDELNKTDQLFAEYVDTLVELQAMVGSPGGALKIMGDYFESQPPTASVASLSSSYAALHKLKNYCPTGDTSADVIWKIIELPTVFLDQYFLQEAGREIQYRWDAEVRSQVAHMPEQKVRAALFGDGYSGLVNSFVQATLKPFIMRASSGYTPRERSNRQFPFTDDFLSFLNNASVWEQVRLPSYKVKLTSLPTSVNEDARVKPYATYLSVHCQTGTHTMKNLNYPVTMEFDWSPETCGSVDLTVMIGDMELKRVYSGPLGLVTFFQEFPHGVRNFTPNSFKDNKSALQRAHVTNLRVGFKAEGADNILKLSRQPRLSIPKTIIK